MGRRKFLFNASIWPPRMSRLVSGVDSSISRAPLRRASTKKRHAWSARSHFRRNPKGRTPYQPSANAPISRGANNVTSKTTPPHAQTITQATWRRSGPLLINQSTGFSGSNSSRALARSAGRFPLSLRPLGQHSGSLAAHRRFLPAVRQRAAGQRQQAPPEQLRSQQCPPIPRGLPQIHRFQGPRECVVRADPRQALPARRNTEGQPGLDQRRQTTGERG